MYEILTIKQMYSANKKALQHELSNFTLMNNAGHGAAEKILNYSSKCNVLILCGPGNNGGDGFIIAQKLKKSGWNVRVASLIPLVDYKNDAARAARAWQGTTTRLCCNLKINASDLIIDALFGIGLSKPLASPVLEIFKEITRKKCSVIAIDIPSGINGDTGEVDPVTLSAERTLTFCRKKQGHLLLPGRDKCGKISIIDIGIPDDIILEVTENLYENTPELWRLDYHPPTSSDHKYTRGHAFIIGGDILTGASCMAAFSALRTGAGLATLCCPKDTFGIYASYNANVMVTPFRSQEELLHLIKNKKNNVILIGPGAGRSDPLKKLVLELLKLQRPMVLDADALSVFQDAPQLLLNALHKNCVLTPHAGEFDKLFSNSPLSPHKIVRVQNAAKKAGCTIVLKGSDTLIATPHHATAINTNAPAYLATAGTGDVLAGIILGFLAQKMPPFKAACAGVYIHGHIAQKIGFGLIAEDLIPVIPHSIKAAFITP